MIHPFTGKGRFAMGLLLAAAVWASAEGLTDNLDVRGGVGADITFSGVAVGAGVNKLFHVGAGYAIAGGLDVRLEVPLVITFSKAGGASTLIPLFTLTAGYRLGP